VYTKITLNSGISKFQIMLQHLVPTYQKKKFSYPIFHCLQLSFFPVKDTKFPCFHDFITFYEVVPFLEFSAQHCSNLGNMLGQAINR